MNASGRASTRGAAEPRAFDADRERAEREDIELMMAFKRGDALAFERLLLRHKKPIYNFCLRMIGDRGAAEDALQDVFLKVIRTASDWQPQAKVTTWLYTIARNHCVDTLRKAAYRKTASLDQTLDAGEERGTTLGERVEDQASIPPDRGAESARLRAKLIAAIGALTEEQREVFIMREQAGMQFKDIAAVVGAPENTVKSRMRYALEHLRAHLARDGFGPEGT